MRQTNTFINSKSSLFIFVFSLFLGTSVFSQSPVTNISDYVLFGGTSAAVSGQTAPASPGYGVTIAASSSVQGGSVGSYKLVQSTGNISCGTSALKTNLYSGGTIVLSNSNNVTGNITAANAYGATGTILSVGTSANIIGNIDVKGNIVIGSGTVTGTVTNPVGSTYKLNNVIINNTKGTPTLPVLPSMPGVAGYSAGATNVSSGTVNPGSYGDLTVGNNTVTLNGPGTYVFKSIKTTGPNASVIYDFKTPATPGNFIIYVVGDVNLNKTSFTIKNGGDATRIYTEVHGTGSTNTGDKTAAFIMSNGSNGYGNVSGWFGALWVPYAAIKMGAPNGPSMTVTGSLWSGTQVNIQNSVTITYARFVLCNLGASAAATNVVCKGSSTGKVDLTITGGTAPYTCVWSNGTTTISPNTSLASVPAGTYSVTVTDARGCTATASATITEPSSKVAASITGKTDASGCAPTGTATAAGSGGTPGPGYTYSWSTVPVQTNPTATGLSAEIYLVTITDSKGCTDTESVKISEPLGKLDGAITAKTDIKCFGSSTGSVTVAGSGGTAPYTYSLDGGPYQSSGTFNGLSASNITLNDHKVTVKDAGECTSDVLVNIKQPDLLSITAIGSNGPVCSGATLNLSSTVTGGTQPYTYSWTGPNSFTSSLQNPSISSVTEAATGTYTLTVTDANGCIANTNNTVSVTVNAIPVANGGDDKPLNFNATTTLGTLPAIPSATYNWVATNGGKIATAADQPTIDVAAAGTYSLTVTSGAGCTATDAVIVTSKVEDLIGSELTSVYKNNPTGLPSPFFDISIQGNTAYIKIDIVVDAGKYTDVLNLLQQTSPVAYGLINILPNGENGLGKAELIITGDFPIANLLNLNALGSLLNHVQPYQAPLTNSGLINSAGDTTMRSNFVRNGYKIDGTGVKVGVISNSFATITNGTTATLPLQTITDPTLPSPQTFTTNTAAQDLSNGDLPAVTVLQDYPVRSTDEGRAMLQIVHDVAPGAQLYFRTGFFTAGDFATGIKDLAAQGCKVIVDDVTYINEPYLKDGVVAKAVNAVKAQGVTYFSAAGNFANKSYENDFKPVDATSIGFPLRTAHDFSGGGGDIFQKIRLTPGNYTIVLQWVDDIYSNGQLDGTKYDLDFYFTSYTDGTGLVGFNRNNIGGDPIETMPFTITTTTDANFLIVNNTPVTTGAPGPARIKYIIYRGDVQILEYDNQSSTIVAQANAAGAIAVGAARYDKAPPYLAAPLIESFSSVGGTQTEGVIRNKPDLVGPDGVNTTVKLGQDYPNSALDGYSNFFGTSAAAPHAAGVAALIMQGKKKFLNQDPSLSTPDDIKSLLQLTSVDMYTANNLPGTKFDFISGYGLVDADSAMRTFAAPAATLIELKVPTNIIPCNGVPLTVTITGENFSRNTVVLIINGPGDTTRIIPTFVSPSEVTVSINSCVGNPEIKAYTPPKAGANGTDGGFSNSKYFFSAYVTVDAVSINKKYGETLVPLDTVIRVNGKLLQDTTVTLQELGLDNMTVTTAATSSSDVGTYAITLNRTFDPNDAADKALLKKYNYKFTNGIVTIAKMPLRITPDNKSITYGQSIGKVTFKYDFDKTKVYNPDSVTNVIKAYHDVYLPKNALAVVKGFKKQQINSSILDTTSLRNMNMIASFNAVKNSRKFTLLNNTLVPITDPAVLQDNLSVQYLVDVASESIYDYKLNPATAKFYPGYPGINPKALLSASSIESDDITKGTVSNTATKITNGLLSQAIFSSDGPIVPMVNGLLVQVVDAIEDGTNDTVQYLSDGSWVKLSNTAQKVLNSSLKIANTTSVKITNGIASVLLPDGVTYAPIEVLLNSTPLKITNSTVQKVVNGVDVTIPDGTYVQLEDGGLVQVKNASFEIVANTAVKVLNTSGKVVNTASKVVNSAMKITNTASKVVNSSALGTDAPNNNTAVILDSQDGIDDGSGSSGLGAMYGINMITGLNVGEQYLVPGTLVDPNFDISYGLGVVQITGAPITITPSSNTKDYDGTTNSVAAPTITSGSLSLGDVAVFKQTYNNKNAGTGKTMTPSVVSILDASGVSAAANYTVTLSNSTNGVINTRAITITPVLNTKTYDGTTGSVATPAITNGTLAAGDIAVFSETYDNKNAGTGKTLIPAVVSIVDGTATSMAGNYLVTLSNSANGVINPRPIQVKANDQYTFKGVKAPAFTGTITPSGTFIPALIGTDNPVGYSSTYNYLSSPAGTYPITPVLNTTNYTMSTATNGTLYVNPNPSADDVDVYADCIEDRGSTYLPKNRRYIAHFYAKNLNSVPVYVPVGDSNRLSSTGSFDGSQQPIVFMPGTGTTRFSVPFDGTSLKWQVKTFEGTVLITESATASSSTRKTCTYSYNALARVANAITSATPANNIAPVDNVNAFPNPTRGKATIYVADDVIKVKGLLLYDAHGQSYQVSTAKQLSKHAIEIDLSGFISGIYLIRVNGENGYKTVSVIKQ